MFGKPLERPALGQQVPLGTLYDSRSDSFLPLSLLAGAPPAAVVITTNVQTNDFKLSTSDTYKQKFADMGLDASISASVLAGLINVEGSGCYLNAERHSNNAMQSALHHTITTVQEKLNLAAPEMHQSLAFRKLEGDVATHVVVGITWGVHTIVAADHLFSDREDRAEIDNLFSSGFASLNIAGNDGSDEAPSMQSLKDGDPLQVTVYSDILPEENDGKLDFASACKSIDDVPTHVAGLDNGKGKPMVYTLLPLSVLTFFLPIEIESGGPSIPQPSIDCLEKFIQMFDDLQNAQRKINDYHKYIEANQSYVPSDYLQSVDRLRVGVKTAERALKWDYSTTLKDVRAGKVDPQQLWDLLVKFASCGNVTPDMVDDLVGPSGYKATVGFVEMMIREGAIYIGYATSSLDTALTTRQQAFEDEYLFYFNNESRQKDIQSWNEHVALLLELLDSPSKNKHRIFVMDCDATGKPLEKISIVHHHDSKMVTEDLLEQRRLLADKSLIRYNEKHLDKSVAVHDKPLKRRMVRIPCPGPDCNSLTICDWICFKCHASVEYGSNDGFMYCDCGRTPSKHCEFKCKDTQHGLKFQRYEKEALYSQQLKNLEPMDELNILILGETGVGKSTFINAFVNYLTFESLDDALAEEKLNHLIPCSFSTQNVDKESKRLVQKEIKIGSSTEDEHNGVSGSSATQKTQVYPVNIGSHLVRLIDTPGIGDTRGVEQDRKNMADILTVLRSYENLHGILILLKPNNSRLTVTFKFCVKELLTHLHRSAANNMVFGFTNTRGSNYQPGDTFRPLETLLNEYKDVDLGLFQHNVYCFDSESFRYLAAYKQGVDMGNMADYRHSWENSAVESQRMLTHFRSLEPHKVKNTLSLNETRALIQQLTKPMADIAQLIKTTIAVNEDVNVELSTKRMTMAELKKRLHVQKITLKAHKIDKPRTVCANTSCVEFHDDGVDGKKKLTTVYKTLCHNPCYLTNVSEDRIGVPELVSCAAFRSRGGLCACGHHWQEHLHILYELRPQTVRVKDVSVERALRDNRSLIELQETAIAAKKKSIMEFQHEHDQIQQAAVQFSLFLKKHSITPYNDATLEYLDYHIKDEKAKVHVGGNPDRLRGLEEYRGEYQQLIEVLTQNMKSDKSCGLLSQVDVDKLVKQLYLLPHYGDNLREIREVVEVAHASTWREKPYRVRAGRHWKRTGENSALRSSRRRPDEEWRPRPDHSYPPRSSGNFTQLLPWKGAPSSRGWMPKWLS
ncbi:hypothetical protein EDC01DRAFT_661363 [Geopyxis carbonaria]|nr:hypothetical protein EDC01DRAFT_661363 [Geopyxis carbonaria]